MKASFFYKGLHLKYKLWEIGSQNSRFDDENSDSPTDYL